MSKVIFPTIGRVIIRGATENNPRQYRIETNIAAEGPTYYYSTDGLVTRNVDEAFIFTSLAEVDDLTKVFYHQMLAVCEGRSPIKSDLFLVSTSGDCYLGQDEERLFITPDLNTAKVFMTPMEANLMKGEFEQLLTLALSSDKARIQTRLIAALDYNIRLREKAKTEAVANLDKAGEAPPMQYLIRFLDPKQENDLEGDQTPCWVRYYCEGALVTSMEAAEWFETPGDVMLVANELREAALSEQMYDASDALMLKLRLLAMAGQSPSLNGVQMTMRDSVLIQVLAVTENETEGYNWNTFFQDNLQWVFDEEVMPAEDEEEDHND